MGLQREVRAIVMQTISTLASDEQIVTATGIDKRAWLKALNHHMATCEPTTHAAVSAEARDAMYGSLIEWFIRQSKDAAIENLRDWTRVLTEAQRGTRMVQFKLDTGGWVAKRERDCTPAEYDALAAQYRRSGAADFRRAAHYEFMAKQMRLAGLADDQPLSRLLAA